MSGRKEHIQIMPLVPLDTLRKRLLVFVVAKCRCSSEDEMKRIRAIIRAVFHDAEFNDEIKKSCSFPNCFLEWGGLRID